MNNQYLSISVFYRQSNWHKLIINFIRPVVAAAYANKIIHSFHIYLGTDKGEHVKLFFICMNHSEQFKTQLSSDLETYLSNNVSYTEPIHYPLSYFFMNYPNNSFIINNAIKNPYGNNESIQAIRAYITFAIVNVLGNDEITIESLYTFIIYLHLGFIHAVWPDIQEAAINMATLNKIAGLTSPEPNNIETKYEQTITQVFDLNKDLLYEIIAEIWNDCYSNSELLWMIEWNAICKLTFNTFNLRKSFDLINELTYEQTGFTKNNQLLLPSLELISNALKYHIDVNKPGSEMH
jgi:hypothetical protein